MAQQIWSAEDDVVHQPRARRRRTPRRNHWCFTSYAAVLPRVFDVAVVRYVIFQREICPESKREHWQGYLELKTQMRMGQVKTLLGDPAAHLSPRMGTRSQARDYCRKK